MLNELQTYLSYGLQALPAQPGKRPYGDWAEEQKQLLTPDQLTARFNKYNSPTPVAHVGIITGKVSGGLEVIDVDCKYDTTDSLWDDFKKLIDDNLPEELVKSLVIDRTPSGGYHIYYRTESVKRSHPLARRPPTAQELEKSANKKLLVLIETRGEGGFIIVPPTADYSLIQGNFSSIPLITTEQQTVLHAAARSLTEEPEPEPIKHEQRKSTAFTDGHSPFDDYNQRDDILDLLQQQGWSYVNSRGPRIYFKRPGETDAKTSGNFHTGFRKWYVFSSSTVFNPEVAYSPADAFAVINGITTKSDLANRLLDAGYGTRGTGSNFRKKPDRVQTSRIHVEAIDSDGVVSDLTTDGYLTGETIRETPMNAAYIYYTADQPTDEVVRALDLLEQTSPVKVYLIEVADLSNKSNPISKLRAYEFRAYDIMRRYDATAEESLEEQDRLIEEFISAGLSLSDPIERARFEGLVLKFSDENELDITKEALAARLEKMRYDAQREAQNQDLTKLLELAATKQKKGDLADALKLLTDRSREISTSGKADTFKALVTPVLEADMVSQLKKKPADILTGYYLGEGPEDEKSEREIRLPAGAITIIAGATSHGKTAFLLDFAIKAAADPLNKSIYVLGYEESGADMTLRAMNAFVNTTFGVNNRRIISSYYQRGANYFRQGTFANFEEGKNAFFSGLIEPGHLSIQYVDYDSDTLIEAIRYLHKHGNAGAIFIDYMQLLRKPLWKSSRQEELKQICLDLKDVAVDTGLPLILAAQFNRKVVNPLRMHPTEIGEAGDIERIANVILGLWNNDKKIVHTEDEEKTLNEDPNYRWGKGLAYVELLKNRGGRPNLAGMLNYDGNTGVLSNYEKPGFTTNKSVFTNPERGH